jgi:hypothetical protein
VCWLYYANDTAGNSAASSTYCFTVADTAPTHGSLVINSTFGSNYSTENITVYNQSTSDLDADFVKNIFNWYVNGTSMTVLNMPFESNNSGGAGKARDYSGYGNNGTVTGAFWNSSGGYDGRGAYQFDGSDDYVDMPSFTPIPSSVVSVEALVNVRTNKNWNRIVNHNWDTSVGGRWLLFSDAAGSAVFGIRDADHTQHNAAAVSALTPGRWYHLVGTYNGSNVSIYVDGVLMGSASASGGLYSSGSIDIGGKGFDHFAGAIDEVRIYNRSLSAQEIRALYENKSNLLVREELSRGSRYSACVTPNDGFVDGATLCSVNLTVLDTPPTHSAPVINSTFGTNYSYENLTVFNQSTFDYDSDRVKNIFNWFVNGTSMTVLNMPFENWGSNGTHNVSNISKDYSPYNNDGSVYSGVVWNASGGYDGRGAYVFAGAADGQNIRVPYSPVLKNNRSFTVSAWVYPHSLAGSRVVLTDGDSLVANTNFILYASFSGGGNAFFGMDMKSGSWCDSGSYGISINNWYLLTGVYDGSSATLYVNGVNRSSGSCASLPDIDTTGLYVGSWANGDGEFDGVIDEVMFFNRSLSGGEVRALYENKSNLLVREELSRGSRYSACVTPNDGFVDGSTLCSVNLTVLDSPPTHLTPVINSTFGTNTSSENITVFNQSTFDYDSDRVKNIYNWFVNGTSITVLNMPFENWGTNGTHNVSNISKDYSGFGNNGTVNGATWNSSGGFDGRGAYVFDGDDDYISIPNVNISSGSFTLSGWVKRFTLTQYGAFMGYNNNHRILISSSGQLLTQFGGNFFSTGVVPLNVWTHICYTYDSVADKEYFYIGGVNDSVHVPTSAPIWNASFLIGQYDGVNYKFNGTIDDVMIFNRSLSAEEVKALYENKSNVLVSQELSVGSNYSACITPNDGYVDGITLCSLNLTVKAVPNSAPTAPVLLLPLENSTTINRTPEFTWNNSFDADGNNLTYEFLLDDNNLFNNLEINKTLNKTDDLNTTYGVELELDVDTVYFWKVRAFDGLLYSDYSATYNFTLESYLAISLLINNVSFGGLANGATANTTEFSPRPFDAENAGNIIANVTITADRLFNSVDYPSEFYQFKIAENETGAFNAPLSMTSWANFTNVSSSDDVFNLDWHDFKDDFLTHVLVRVPQFELAGERSSIVTFTIQEG